MSLQKILEQRLFMAEPHIHAMANSYQRNIVVIDARETLLSIFLYKPGYANQKHIRMCAAIKIRQGADQPIWLLMTLGHFSALQLAAFPLAPFDGEAGSAQRPLAQLSARRRPLDRALATIDAETHTALSSEPSSEDESVGEDD